MMPWVNIFFFKEKVFTWDLIASCVGFIGVILIIELFDSASWKENEYIGNLCALMAALFKVID